jgi:hypothetical protein
MMKTAAEISAHETRLHDRRDVLIGIRLRRKGESWFTSRITDLSLTGCRLSSFARLEEGMDVWIMLPGFDGRRAVVSWVHNHEAGCTFERPLHPAIFDHIIRMSDPRARG